MYARIKRKLFILFILCEKLPLIDSKIRAHLAHSDILNRLLKMIFNLKRYPLGIVHK